MIVELTRGCISKVSNKEIYFLCDVGLIFKECNLILIRTPWLSWYEAHGYQSHPQKSHQLVFVGKAEHQGSRSVTKRTLLGFRGQAHKSTNQQTMSTDYEWSLCRAPGTREEYPYQRAREPRPWKWAQSLGGGQRAQRSCARKYDLARGLRWHWKIEEKDRQCGG